MEQFVTDRAMLEADYAKRLMKLHSRYRVTSQHFPADDADMDPALAVQESSVQLEVGLCVYGCVLLAEFTVGGGVTV